MMTRKSAYMHQLMFVCNFTVSVHVLAEVFHELVVLQLDITLLLIGA